MQHTENQHQYWHRFQFHVDSISDVNQLTIHNVHKVQQNRNKELLGPNWLWGMTNGSKTCSVMNWAVGNATPIRLA